MRLHPALDADYPAGVSAFRQLTAGAKVTFQADHYALYHREGFDHIYYRGLALRHSNGGTGKYEAFTYVATPELLQWAREHLIFPTCSELISRCGLNEKNEIRNLRRRLRYASQVDRPKAFPRLEDVAHRVLVEAQAPDALTTNEDWEVSSKALTDWYVAEFCRLNTLKG